MEARKRPHVIAITLVILSLCATRRTEISSAANAPTVQLSPRYMNFVCDYHLPYGCVPRNLTRTATLTKASLAAL
jgi:hypothetical protein